MLHWPVAAEGGILIGRTELPEELSHAAPADGEGVVDGRLDDLPVPRPQSYRPLQRQREAERESEGVEGGRKTR